MTPTIGTLKFDLDTSAVIPGGAGEIELTGATASDVLAAVARNEQFPERQIDLASVGLQVNGGQDINFVSAAGKVKLVASASADLQVGIFDKGSEVLARLALEDADEIGLELRDQPAMRYALFLAGYSVEGTASGSHPIGVLGSVTFGVEGQRAARYAIVHCFKSGDGARDVLQDTFANVKLPRHVTEASGLRPFTHLITEVDGSIALRMSTQLGYDFNFVREAKAMGLQGDVGLRIEAGVKAFIGLEVSGRYLLALERPSIADSIRLRLFKLRKKGLTFGLNLSAKVQPVVDILPDNVDDLTKAVFGVHGQQVIRDLKSLEKWTDKDSDPSDIVAGLANKAGLDLLEKTTGLDPRVKFNEARAVLIGAIEKWEALPSGVSSLLQAELEDAGLSGSRRDLFEATLKLLASADPAKRKEELLRLLSKAGIENDLAGRFVIAASDRGLAALLDRSEELREAAGLTLDILNGRVIEKLQAFITERLDLDRVLQTITRTEFDDLDEWLVQRLSGFLDQKLRFEDLDQVKDAIHMVLQKRQDIYAKMRQALTRRYDFDLAFRYQTATSKSALLDATFETSEPAARKLLKAIVEDSSLDDLLTTPTAGVSLAKAVLTHEITRQTSVEVHLPYYDTKTTSLTTSLARVSAQEDGGRVLFYELTADDTITKNRLKSQLALSASLLIRPGAEVRIHRNVSQASWSYQFLQIAPNLRRKELEERIGPLALEYFPNHFPGGSASLSAFITDFDRVVEEAVHNGTDEFGDLLLSLEVSVPSRVMAAWFRPRTKDQAQAAARAASINIQRGLQKLMPFYFFSNLDKLHQNLEASPLLVFSALPPLPQFRIEGSKAVLEAGPIWDVRDPAKRAFVVSADQTIGRLGAIIASQRARLMAAGRSSQAGFFEPSEVRDFLRGVADHPNFMSLLHLVSVAAHGVADALEDLRQFEADADSRPSKAVERLAEFGAEIVRTFNKELKSVYGGEMLRPLGSLVFLESACALDSMMTNVRPNALLAMTVLKEQRTYRMEDFLSNQLPAADQIAVQQRLVTAS